MPDTAGWKSAAKASASTTPAASSRAGKRGVPSRRSAQRPNQGRARHPGPHRQQQRGPPAARRSAWRSEPAGAHAGAAPKARPAPSKAVARRCCVRVHRSSCSRSPGSGGLRAEPDAEEARRKAGLTHLALQTAVDEEARALPGSCRPVMRRPRSRRGRRLCISASQRAASASLMGLGGASRRASAAISLALEAAVVAERERKGCCAQPSALRARRSRPGRRTRRPKEAQGGAAARWLTPLLARLRSQRPREHATWQRAAVHAQTACRVNCMTSVLPVSKAASQ